MSSLVRVRESLLYVALIGAALTLLANLPPSSLAHAQSSSEIQSQIDSHNKRIADLEKEIAQYERQLNVLSGQKQTLQSAISTLDVSRKQTQTQVSATQSKINATDLTLSQIRRDISTKEDLIELDRDTVAKALRDLNAAKERTLVEQILSAESLTAAWTEADQIATINQALQQNVTLLQNDKIDLSNKQDAAQQTRNKLASLRAELVDQQRALDANKQAKTQLLNQTKSQEATYQKLLTQKRAEQASFEAAIYQLSQQLKSADTSTIPKASKGVLAWPVSNPRLTQYFGRTSDSGRLYASGTHDGIDLGMPTGTIVRSALSGTVMQVNQGAVQNCQYGKWVLVKHANGLATLYAHLSTISVSPGQSVTTGQTIGYSGMTGYATGPHLHFTVYLASSVTFKQYACKSGGGTVTVPIAPPNGYLDPMAYLGA